MKPILNATRDLNCQTVNLSGNFGHILDFATSCQLASEFNFSGINLDLFREPIDVTTRQRLLESYQLEAASFDFPVNLFAEPYIFERGLKLFYSVAPIAESLGCKTALCYVPPFSKDLSFEKLFKLYVDRLKQVKPLLEAHQIKVAFEFIGPVETRLDSKYDFIHTMDGIRCLIAAADIEELAGFKLDIHHWQTSGAGKEDLIHCGASKILYVELNDALPGFTPLESPEFQRRLPLSTGVTRVQEFMNTLAKIGYQGPIAVEPWDQKLADMPLRQAIGCARKSLAACIDLAKKKQHICAA